MKIKAYHQWKATTANVISAVNGEAGRDVQIDEVVDELESLFEEFKQRQLIRTSQLRQGFSKIVKLAVELDEIFCGQASWYFLAYPKQRHGAVFREESMRMMDNNYHMAKVKLVIRPGLRRLGGERGENWEAPLKHLEPCEVLLL
jgi:hypothetical protein